MIVENVLTDWLHTMDLGVGQYCSGFVSKILFEQVWGADLNNKEEQIRRGLLALRPRFEAWAKTPAAIGLKPTFRLTKNTVLGSEGLRRPMTKMKGLESRAFLYFVIDELEVKMSTLFARPGPTPRICSDLHKYCALLRELYDLVMGSGVVMSAVDALRAKELLAGHATMLRRAGRNWLRNITGPTT